MTDNLYVRSNDVVDFSGAKAGWSKCGKVVVVSVSFGRKWYNWSLTGLEGEMKGRTFTARTREQNFASVGGKNLGANAQSKKAVVAAQELKAARSETRYVAAREAQKQFEVGDIVRIDNGKRERSWDMKVLEIDYEKGRVWGVNANPGMYGVGSKRAWASLTHPDVTITLVQKNAFDPNTDDAVAEQQAKAAEAGGKRALTRYRKDQLRKMFGSF